MIFYIFKCPLKTGQTEETQQERSELENLPSEILKQIIHHLPRRDQIALAYTTHNPETTSRIIIDDYYEPGRKIKITDETLSFTQNSNNLLKYLENHYITEINLSWTKIDDESLKQILMQGGHNLIRLSLQGCENLQNPDFSYCPQLQKLDLWGCIKLQNPNFSNLSCLQTLYLTQTNINDAILDRILEQVGQNLKILGLARCQNLQNPNFSNCSQLTVLILKDCLNLQDINLNYCTQLQELNPANCPNLQNLEAIENWAKENNIIFR